MHFLSPLWSAPGQLWGRRASSLGLDVTTKCPPVRGGTASWPQGSSPPAAHPEQHPTTARQWQEPAPPETQLGSKQAPCWGENPALSPAGKSRMETRDWFCWEAASPDLPDPTSPEHARSTAPHRGALYQGHLVSPPATMPSSCCTAPCCPDTKLFLATRDKQAWD